MAFYNVSKIENWFDDFTSCKNKFINTYYDDYQDSYIRTCNDEIIRKMKTQLDNHYNKIKRIYNRINDHWSNYLNDLKNIDNCIAGTSNPFSVYAPAPAAKLNSLPCLKEYEANLATKIESFSGYIGTVTFLGWSEDKDTSENLLYIFERTGATVGTAVVSVIEGIGMFGEGIVDVCTTVVSECYCQVRLAVDDDFTEKQADIIRESTRDVVSTQYVKNKFDSFYQESDVGAYLSENAYAFDAVRSIGNEVGIVVGAVVVSSLTQGAIPPSVLYGISKAGNHIEENFQDENNGYFESIVKGGLAGALDGVFFAAGAKGDQVLKATIGKSAAKNLFAFGGKMGYEAFCAVSQDGSNIVLDSLFMDNQIVDNNGNTIYFENYKDKLSYCYEQAGGKEAIIESLVTSVVLSGMSDGVDTIKAVRNIDAGSAIKNIDVSSSSIDTNASGISKQIDGISSKTSVFDDVETNGVNIDSNTAVKNMDINSSSMGTNTSKISKQIDEVTSKTSIFNEENIAALNNKIAKDNFVGIKVDSEADIPDDIWERISRPKNDKDVWITTADGKKYYWGEDVHPRMLEGNEIDNVKVSRNVKNLEASAELPKITQNGKTSVYSEQRVKNNNLDIDSFQQLKVKKLKKDILDTIGSDYDEIQTIRKLYIELNKRVNYDVNFALGDSVTKKEILDKVITFDNLTNSNVVCKGWSELYSEILVDAGIEPSRIRVVKAQNARHWWVEIDMGNSIIRADATDAFLGSTDLANCKFGDKTNGFLILDKINSGLRVNNKILTNNPSILTSSNDYFRDVDKSIQYINGDDYFSDNVSKLRSIFSKETSPYDVITKDINLQKSNIQNFLQMEVPQNMNGYDAFAYYRKFSNALFGQGNSLAIPSLKKININGKNYSAVEICLYDGKQEYFLTFDEINGKKIYSRDEYLSGPIDNYKPFE